MFKLAQGGTPISKKYMGSYGYTLIVLDDLIPSTRVITLGEWQNLEVEVFEV